MNVRSSPVSGGNLEGDVLMQVAIGLLATVRIGGLRNRHPLREAAGTMTSMGLSSLPGIDRANGMPRRSRWVRPQQLGPLQ